MESVALSIILVYISTSCWETFVHWKVLHADARSKRAWKRIGGLFNLLRKANFSHNMIHHIKTYRSNYYTQFDSRKEKEGLDSKLVAHSNFRVIGNRYGLNISGFWEIAVFTVVPVCVAVLVFSVLAPAYIALGVFIALTPMMLSKYLHPFLHDQFPSSSRAPFVLRLLVNSKYFSYIQKYHYIHHRHVSCNFNLMPGGDYLLGVAGSLKPDSSTVSGELGIEKLRVTRPFSRSTKGARR